MAGRGNPAWVKGQSGNPSGRPKIPEDVRELAKAHTREAILTQVEIMRDGDAPPAARVAASNAILDRAWGKPAQTINANVRRSLADITDAELAAIAAGSGAEAPEPEDGARLSDRVH